MTPKQKERIQQKIKTLKSALAADKRFWGKTLIVAIIRIKIIVISCCTPDFYR